jgi:hypothetical protein
MQIQMSLFHGTTLSDYRSDSSASKDAAHSDLVFPLVVVNSNILYQSVLVFGTLVRSW